MIQGQCLVLYSVDLLRVEAGSGGSFGWIGSGWGSLEERGNSLFLEGAGR